MFTVSVSPGLKLLRRHRPVAEEKSKDLHAACWLQNPPQLKTDLALVVERGIGLMVQAEEISW